MVGERRHRQKRGHPKWILRPKRSRIFGNFSCRGPCCSTGPPLASQATLAQLHLLRAICHHYCEALLRCCFFGPRHLHCLGYQQEASKHRHWETEHVATAPTRRMKQKSTESNMTYGSEPCFGFKMAFPGGTTEFQNIRNLL